MNISTLTVWHPKAVVENWQWVPKASYSGWPLKNGNNIWYFSIEWLNGRLDIDNED